ncbi:CoA transferase [Paenarthrobacter nitroguajacolicus]|uniref:CaiB/BaiF CoA-transferase family protein n=1 Tax=Paenarthrobacter nitroguajacolicus TaxID=211146 RepID=UPI0015BF7E85|nr:CoA transferase [Paenarthrobacter nitroguajacolicus]NWL10279.1 CoA transferase [Paenarthrobacter nitroguajacolicus]
MTALSGIRVLDLSDGVAAPIVGMFLGDFGADVIHVAGQEVDWAADLPGAAVWNRNKRSVALIPGDPEGTIWLADSMKAADVCILGDQDDLSIWGKDVVEAMDSNRSLIVVRMPPYLEGYTPWPGGKESNGLLAALGGMAMRQSSVTGGPIESVSPYLLYIHGIWAAACTVAALVERTISNRGQTVTVTGVNALSISAAGAFSVDPSRPDAPTDVGPAGRHPTYRPFKCADGIWVSCGALGPKFEQRLLHALDLDSILRDPRIDNVTSRMTLPENLEWCVEKISAAFQARTSDELVNLITSLGIPAAKVASRDEWLDHPQIRSIGMRAEVEDPRRGRVTMPGIPLRLTRSPGEIRLPAPTRGQHNGIAPWPTRGPAGRRSDETNGDRYVAGPLSGFHILNTGTFVATPFAGFLLSELGATVTKIEAPGGDPFRASAYTFNRGMRSLCIDLSRGEGQAAFHRLATVADVVIDGMRPGVMRKLNIDFETLSAFNPRLVTMSLSAFGEGGPLSAEPGVDMVIQAMSGMMSAWGGEDDPVANTVAINDVTAAAITVLTCVLGLYHRQITGEGQRTWDSLAATSAVLQMGELVRFEGRPSAAVGRRDLRGLEPLKSYYRTIDGWVYLDDAAPDNTGEISNRIADVLSFLGDSADGAPTPEKGVPGELERVLRGLSTADAISRLTAAGIRAVRARRVSEALRDPRLLAAEAFHIHDADDGGSFMTPGRHVSFSRTQRRGPLKPPGAGEHTIDVLTEAGFSAEEIAGLVACDVVRTGSRMTHVLPIPYR